MLDEGLTFWNPWWDGNTERLDRVQYRPSLDEVRPLFKRKEILAITGARRSGKTSLMYMLIRGTLKEVPAKQILYVNLDDPTFEDSHLPQILDAYERLMDPRGKRYIFLDEVQRKEGWERWLKRLYDSHEDVKLVVSGSNGSLLMTEYSTLLTGRDLAYELFPLSFREFLGFRGIEIGSEVALLRNKNRLLHMLDEYMGHGGFPEVALTDDVDMKVMLLKRYFRTIIAHDVIARFDVREKGKLEKLAVYLVTNMANEVSAKSIAKVLELTTTTVREHMDHFEDAYLFFYVNHFSYSLKSQYTYARKVYCLDTGLRNAISFRFSRDVGRLMENVVYLELRKRGEVYYWSQRGTEVDFVLKEDLEVSELIQVCYDMSEEATRTREVGSLRKGMEEFGLGHGTIVTMDEEGTEDLDQGTISLVPLWKWLLLDRKG
jgi:predicted AAA+ superfamily ATPase